MAGQLYSSLPLGGMRLGGSDASNSAMRFGLGSSGTPRMHLGAQQPAHYERPQLAGDQFPSRVTIASTPHLGAMQYEPNDFSRQAGNSPPYSVGRITPRGATNDVSDSAAYSRFGAQGMTNSLTPRGTNNVSDSAAYSRFGVQGMANPLTPRGTNDASDSAAYSRFGAQNMTNPLTPRGGALQYEPVDFSRSSGFSAQSMTNPSIPLGGSMQYKPVDFNHQTINSQPYAYGRITPRESTNDASEGAAYNSFGAQGLKPTPPDTDVKGQLSELRNQHQQAEMALEAIFALLQKPIGSIGHPRAVESTA